MGDCGAKGSWSDNESVSALAELARAVDHVAGLVPARLSPGDTGTQSDAALPLQNLPAHVVFARHWEKHRSTLLRERTTRPCPLCGGSDRSPWFHTQDGYQYDICSSCGMVHIPEVLPLPVWDRYFASLPQALDCLRESMQQSIQSAAWERDRTRFGRYLALMREHGAAHAGDRLLDLGSFTGSWLRAAADEGLSAHGVEGLAEAVTFAREHFPNLKLLHGRTEDLGPGVFGGQFDLVTMWETLEHTFDPVSSLQRAAAALRPGGLIALSVPNSRNVQFSALGPYCFYAYGGYHYTGHINMFSPDTLKRALETAGFDLVHLSTEFGTDWRQVLYYLRHQFDRVHCYRNLVRRGDAAEEVSAEISVLLNWLSPALTRLENACTAGPILVALARRRDGPVTPTASWIGPE